MECVFCDIVAGTAPATIYEETTLTLAFTPLDPVIEGHMLFISKPHFKDALADPGWTAITMLRAVEYARKFDDANILTNIGKAAKQSVFHLHIHVVPRKAGDQLMLPWGTTGNPHDPHWCKQAQALQDILDNEFDYRPDE